MTADYKKKTKHKKAILERARKRLLSSPFDRIAHMLRSRRRPSRVSKFVPDSA